MKNMRLGLLVTIFMGLFTLVGFNGCGGGGGGSSSTTSSTTTSSIDGTVQASILKGVKVCIKGTSTCATTDVAGKFSISGFAAPQTLEIYVGDSKLGEVIASVDTISVTPKLLADGNATIASRIGVMLHKIGGCKVADTRCDLSSVKNVDINISETKSLIEELKEAMRSSKEVNLKVDGKELNITSADIAEYEIQYPEMVSNSTKFSGAASVGDFATFSYNKDTNELTYTMKGSVFGAKNGTQKLTNLNGNVFFKDMNDNFYFFSGSLAVAQIPMDNDKVSYIVGLQMPQSDITDPSLFVNKRFNYIEFSNQTPEFNVIDINASSSNATSGTWTDILDQSNGTWILNGSHLDIKDSSGNKVANGIIRPATKANGRAGFVIDNVTGGFGIGVEAKPLKANELSGEFYYYDRDLNNTPNYQHWKCYGKVIVNGTSFKAQDEYCSDSKPPYAPDEGNLTLNPTVTIGRTPITLNGLAKVSSTEYAFIDPESGYYISIDFGEPMISIGSNKPLK